MAGAAHEQNKKLSLFDDLAPHHADAVRSGELGIRLSALDGPVHPPCATPCNRRRLPTEPCGQNVSGPGCGVVRPATRGHTMNQGKLSQYLDRSEEHTSELQ